MRRPHSYSSLSTFKKCPHLFEWKYVLGKRDVPMRVTMGVGKTWAEAAK